MVEPGARIADYNVARHILVFTMSKTIVTEELIRKSSEQGYYFSLVDSDATEAEAYGAFLTEEEAEAKRVWWENLEFNKYYDIKVRVIKILIQ